MLNKFLESIGLKEKDQRVYLALLGLADAPVGLISQKAEVKRTTTYHILENLIKNGLVSSYKEKGIKRFVAENPSKIKTFLEGRISALEKYLPNLRDLYDLSRARPTVRFFEGEDAMKQIAEEALESKEKTICSIGSVEKVKRASGTSIRFAKRRAEKKIFSRALRLKGEKFRSGYIEKQREELREVRFLPEDIKISVMIHIYDNKVSVICPKEENFGFTIESENFAKSMKSIFETLWRISTSP